MRTNSTTALGLICLLLPILATAESPRFRFGSPVRLGLHFNFSGPHHERIALKDAHLEANLSLRNQTGEVLSYRGEPASADEAVVLSGDWRMFLDEIRLGEERTSKPLIGVDAPQSPEVRFLNPDTGRAWKLDIDLATLADHPGNYRLRVQLGIHEHSSALFRVAVLKGRLLWGAKPSVGAVLQGPRTNQHLITNRSP